MVLLVLIFDGDGTRESKAFWSERANQVAGRVGVFLPWALPTCGGLTRGLDQIGRGSATARHPHPYREIHVELSCIVAVAAAVLRLHTRLFIFSNQLRSSGLMHFVHADYFSLVRRPCIADSSR